MEVNGDHVIVMSKVHCPVWSFKSFLRHLFCDPVPEFSRLPHTPSLESKAHGFFEEFLISGPVLLEIPRVGAIKAYQTIIVRKPVGLAVKTTQPSSLCALSFREGGFTALRGKTS